MVGLLLLLALIIIGDATSASTSKCPRRRARWRGCSSSSSFRTWAFTIWSTLCPLPTPTNRHKNLNSIALTRSNPNCVLLSLPVLLPAGCSSPISY